jgi:hypothetical protein
MVVSTSDSHDAQTQQLPFWNGQWSVGPVVYKGRDHDLLRDSEADVKTDHAV